MLLITQFNNCYYPVYFPKHWGLNLYEKLILSVVLDACKISLMFEGRSYTKCPKTKECSKWGIQDITQQGTM
jgi:hypothetical protein